jgi:tRNA G10  N-methylase Trm11
MPHFIFVHGKNPELSLAEIIAIAGAKPVEANQEFSVFDLLEAKDLTARLGGTLKVAEVMSIIEPESGREAIEKIIEKNFGKLLYGFKGGRLLFGVSFYGATEAGASVRTGSAASGCGEGDGEALGWKIKELAKAEGLKVSAAHMKGSSMTHTKVLQKKVLQKGFELVICMGKKNLYIARTVWVHDPFQFRKRDMERPCQRPIYSIPPRLARIMINLSCVRKGGVVMDPFCGIGTILQEAVVMGMQVFGVDTKDNCIGETRKNLSWLEKEYGVRVPEMENRIRKEDARWLSKHFSEVRIDAIVTEPYMGPPLKRRPDRVHAMRILDGLRQLYEHSLAEMLKTVRRGGRIVIVSPAFIVRGKFYGLNIASMSGRLGGKPIDPLAGAGIPHQKPMRDFEERHNTIREINVIERAH